ncbi:hypothetical protein evm_006249 [Chilo suppressalis]|nr:hypothetical protein evm_006249 [Chilo suppressalis]
MKTNKKRPYKSNIMSIKECNKTTLPRQKAEFGPLSSYKFELYNTTNKNQLLRGNITLRHHSSNFWIKSDSYILKDGKWTHQISLPEMDCNNPVPLYIIKMTTLRYDPKTCAVQKGFYQFSNVDLNALEHLWAREREYGIILWKTEILTKYYTLFCVVVETIVQPLQYSRKKT